MTVMVSVLELKQRHCKIFSYEGDTDGGLWGMQLCKSRGGKRIAVTEGELYCMSVWEAQPGWEVVPLPNSICKAIYSEELRMVANTRRLYFSLTTTQRARGRCRSCRCPTTWQGLHRLSEDYKDGSDALMDGQAADIKAVCNFNHELYRPDGIVEGKSLLDFVTTPNPPNDHDYPFQGLQNKLHGIRYGELVTITAGSGIGKSSVCRDIATQLLQKGERVGYLALEESNRRTALGLMSAAVGKSLHLGTPKREELVDAFDATMANWNLYLFDGFAPMI